MGIRKFTHLILDEVHERDLDMDLLCLVIKKIRDSFTAGFKLILMSATLQQRKMIEYFNRPCQFSHGLYVGLSPFTVRTVFLEDLGSYLSKEKYDRLAKRIGTSTNFFNCSGLKTPQVFSQFIFHLFCFY